MDLDSLKKLAEDFRAVADSQTAVRQLCDDTRAAHPSDDEVRDLCDQMVACADGGAVRALCDRVKARTA